jgi:type I restriction enzyme, S subunit
VSFVHRIDDLLESHGNSLTGKASHWERVPLGRVAKVVNGYPFPSSGFNNDEGVPVLRIRDIVAGVAGTLFKGNTGDAPWVTRGDLVIGMDGDFNSCLWPGEAAVINQRVCKVVPDETIYSKRLLSYALPAYLRLVNDHTSAITVKHLSSGTVQELPLPLPPRAEQDRLVNKLDELFSRLEDGERALERVRALVESYRQSVLKAAVTGELTREWRKRRKGDLQCVDDLLHCAIKARRAAWEDVELGKRQAQNQKTANNNSKQRCEAPSPPDTAALPGLPDGWTWASLDMLAEVVGGITVDQKRSTMDCRPVPYLRVANVQRGHLDLSEVKAINAPRERLKQLQLQHGDILFNEGGDIDKLGRGWIWENQLPMCIHQNHVFRARLFVGSDLNKIISWYGNVLGRKLFIGLGKQTTNLASLSLSKLKQFPVPLMSAMEASEIVNRAEDILSVLDKLSEELAAQEKRSYALRQSVLSLAFSGRLVAQSSSDEPAASLLKRLTSERPKAADATEERGRRKKQVA